MSANPAAGDISIIRTRGVAYSAALFAIALAGCSNDVTTTGDTTTQRDSHTGQLSGAPAINGSVSNGSMTNGVMSHDSTSSGAMPNGAMSHAAPANGAAPAAENSAGRVTVARASFTAANEARLPVGYRQWVHVGTRDNARGKVSILDGKSTQTPEVLNAYVEPGAFAAYQKTGEWPDGSQLVKEFSAVRVGADCQTDTLFCTTELGQGIFQTGYVGLGMMVKDEKRFPDAPGHWGFFHFGHHPPPYDPVSPVRPAEQCSSCHVVLASKADFVISRAHIGLSMTGTP